MSKEQKGYECTCSWSPCHHSHIEKRQTDFDRVTAERDAERRRADVAVADANDAEAAGKKVSEMLATRTAERDAALGRVTELESSFDELAAAVGFSEARLDQTGDSPIDCAKQLQQRLTAADERADVLGGQLAESERKRLEFVDAVKVETDLIEANHSSCVMVPEGYAVVPIKPKKAMREACQIAGKLPVWDAMMAAALKPAEGSTCNQIREEIGLPINTTCQACGRGACIDR